MSINRIGTNPVDLRASGSDVLFANAPTGYDLTAVGVMFIAAPGPSRSSAESVFRCPETSQIVGHSGTARRHFCPDPGEGRHQVGQSDVGIDAFVAIGAVGEKDTLGPSDRFPRVTEERAMAVVACRGLIQLVHRRHRTLPGFGTSGPEPGDQHHDVININGRGAECDTNPTSKEKSMTPTVLTISGQARDV
ncbi:hypothetical protein [Rhodococcus globerulus]|uniref:Uncharacterized protein n=1 Tax=Rhodococcus globerulus TaxID=33008 RepID=A0ABU4C3E8_RHOGO|nr:hypothetical protein [Rhodococcus globerulus]MDV6271030.1 hypothetical protein [Rhodococcus globerulus]